MYNNILREVNGRFLGKLGNDFFHETEENETYFDIKIRPEDIIFPQHEGSMVGEVKVYPISELYK